MEKLLAVLLCLGLVGCASTPTVPITYQDNSVVFENGYKYINYEVDIISDPPGAKIEWNNDYIGETPCKKIINGYLTMIDYLYLVKVVANPVSPGQYVQTKVLTQDPLPRTIYFNMNLGPQTPAVDVNVNQGKQQ